MHIRNSVKHVDKVEETCLGCKKLHSNTQSHSFILDYPVGLNVGMSGDTTDSSDGDSNWTNELDKPFGLVGLQNVGNTCYMNAALQALSNTLPLTNFFLECSTSVLLLSEGKKPGLSRTYQALIRDMWIKKKCGYVNPSGILHGIRNVHAMFRGYHQHDTQEFLRNFMDQLHEELKQVCLFDVANDIETFSLTIDEASINSSFESSEGEYETCDSGVSERSSLSDDVERSNNSNRKLSQSNGPYHRLKSHFQHTARVSESQSGSNSSYLSSINPIKYRSIISDIFDGKLLSSVQCLTCSRISSKIETFQDLSLPIPSRDHVAVLHERKIEIDDSASVDSVSLPQVGWLTWVISWFKSWFYGPTVSLHDCLAAFFSTDELKGDNMYSCERCKKLRNGIKFNKVLQLPEVLCIHLKRFRHELMYSSKISSFVSFPLKCLDMKLYLHSDCISNVTTYDLFAVICHHGTAGGGHYTCFALNGNQWYEFDDQYVTKVNAETVQSSEAYVLFYRKTAASAQMVKLKAHELTEADDHKLEACAYISKQWLSRFKTCVEPGPIDNSDFLCLHNLLHPERSTTFQQLVTVIPKKLYDYLFKKYGGSSAVMVMDMDICLTCQTLLKRITFELDSFLKLNRDLLNRRSVPTHLLSAFWFDQWQNFVQRCSFEPPGPIDNNRALSGVTNDYIEITEEIWNFFYTVYGGGPEMPIFINKIYHNGDNIVNDMHTNSCSNDSVFPKQKYETQNCCSIHGVKPVEASIDNNYIDRSELANSDVEHCLSSNVHHSDSAVNKLQDKYTLNISSRSSTSLSEDEVQEKVMQNLESNKTSLRLSSKDKLHYRTRKRRFRTKIGYKKHLNNVNKNIKNKSFS